MKKLVVKDIRIISIALAIWGMLFISSGVAMVGMQKVPNTTLNELAIVQKSVSQVKTNEIKLKDITVEINQPISVDIKDYLQNIDELDYKTLEGLRLDTSMVNIMQAGSYIYTVTYGKKTYNGTYIVKPKELPKIDLTLKNFKLELSSAIPTDLKNYVVETLTEEVTNNITLDISNVNTEQAGIYQYSITYNNKLYTGTIEVYQSQTKVITQNQNNDKDKNEEN